MVAERLSEAKIARLTSNKMYGDGKNLWLKVTNEGKAKSWVFRWTETGTRNGRNIGLGSYVEANPLEEPRALALLLGLRSGADVSLDEARVLARHFRRLLKEGKDPEAERDGARLGMQVNAGLIKTVTEVTDEYYALKIALRSADYRKTEGYILNKYVHEKIGHMPIRLVGTSTILESGENKVGLLELWKKQNPTGTRLQFHLWRIFKIAIRKKYYLDENPAAWKGHLEDLLPRSSDVHKRKHHQGLRYKEVGQFLKVLRAYKDRRQGQHGSLSAPSQRPSRRTRRRAPTNAPLLLEFLVLTGVRTKEARLSTWDEFDFGSMIWNMPAAHDKNGKDREIPITKPMLAVLNELKKRRVNQASDAIVFRSPHHRETPLVAAGVWNFAKKTLKYEIKFTVHAFRSTLKDWWRANNHPMDLFEMQVGHVLGSKSSGQPYGHDRHLDERRRYMELWGEYCSKPSPEPQGGDVVSLHHHKRRTA